MSNHYFDYDSEKVISLRLQDYDQYPDTSAGKVTRRQSTLSKDRYRQANDYTQSASRRSRASNAARSEKSNKK